MKMFMNSFQTLQTVIQKVIEIPTRQLARWLLLDRIEESRFTWFDRITFSYLILWFFIIAWNYRKFNQPYVYLGYDLLLIIVLWLIANFNFQTEVGKFLRYAYVMFYVTIFFTSLHYLIPVLNPVPIDERLIRMDYWLFGTHPTVWLEKLYWAPLSEYLQYCYTSYYFIPIFLGIYLYIKGFTHKLQVFLLAICLGFYLSYLGYLLFPALGPRFFLAYLHTQPLKGVLFFEAIQNALNSLENIQYDAFPSGHTAIIIIVLFYAYRFTRKFFWFFLIIGVSLIFSTVYLRYHYVVDVLGGIGVGIVAIYVTEWLQSYSGSQFR